MASPPLAARQMDLWICVGVSVQCSAEWAEGRPSQTKPDCLKKKHVILKVERIHINGLLHTEPEGFLNTMDLSKKPGRPIGWPVDDHQTPLQFAWCETKVTAKWVLCCE